MARELVFYVEKEGLLRDFLVGKISNKALKKIKSHGHLYVNNQEQTVRYRLTSDDIVRIVFPIEEKGRQMKAIDKPFTIMYEDDYFLVIDKDKGIPCIPNHRYDESLANYVLGYYRKHGIDTTVHFVNRLDKDTSGLLLVAKYRYEQYKLSQTKITRKYICLVDGQLLDSGSIEAPIYREGLSIKRSIDQRGIYAKTNYKGLCYHNGYSFVECELETGRTHQIRVHLASIGFPIVGDSLYGKSQEISGGQLLDSYYLSFYHPYSKEVVVFEKKKLDWRHVYD